MAKSPKSVIGLPSEIGNLPQFGPCRLPLPPATTTRSQTKFKTPWGSSRVTARPHTCACRAACVCGKSVSRPPSLQIKLGGRPLRGPDLPGDWDVRNQRFLPETNLERPPDWCSPSRPHRCTHKRRTLRHLSRRLSPQVGDLLRSVVSLLSILSWGTVCMECLSAGGSNTPRLTPQTQREASV